MSRENVEVVRRCVQVFNDRAWSAIPDLVDPEFELDLSRNIFNPDVYHGHAGLERWASAVEDVWVGFCGVLTEVTDVGDAVVSGVTMHGKGRESGVDVEMKVFSVWTFRESKVLRIVGGYRDRAQAVEAARLAGGA